MPLKCYRILVATGSYVIGSVAKCYRHLFIIFPNIGKIYYEFHLGWAAEDFTTDLAYNFMVMAFSFRVTSGISPQQASEELHGILDEAIQDFLKQVFEDPL